MKVKAGKGFNNVFGADDLLRYFPELNSEGVEVRYLGDFYYIFKNGKQQGDSCFFSQEEIDNYMIVVGV